jgi:hypothetical protein
MLWHNRGMKKLRTAMLILASVSVLIADGTRKPITDLAKWKDGFVSPLKDFEVRYLIHKSNPDDGDGTREIWLHPLAEKGMQPFQLCEFARDADVLFSPDENWIAVNDFVGSNYFEIVLYKRAPTGRYEKSKDGDPTGSAWALFKSKYDLPHVTEDLFHVYSAVKEWSPDSRSFVIVLWGHSDSDHHVDDWLCTFDLQTMKAYLAPEQKEKNKGAVHFSK